MRNAFRAVVVLNLFLSCGVLSGLAQTCLPPKVPVTFTYVPLPDERVVSVSLRGSFNNWGEWPMTAMPDGTWTITACLEPGVHQYKFFINGRWPRDMATARGGGPVDPQADYYVDDGFGGQNAVRVVKPVFVGAAPFHDPQDPAYLCVADGRAVIRLRVATGQVQEVNLVTDQGTFPMRRQARWDWGEIWRVALPEVTALTYRFAGVAADDSPFTYPEDPKTSFTFAGVDRFPQITWVSQGVGYQIFPERFHNGDPANDALALVTDIYHDFTEEFWQAHWAWTGLPSEPPLLSGWSDPIHPLHCCHQYFGGDLRGILERLDYLASLGVTVLYLNPIFDAGSAHGYDTRDYLRVSPKFGTEEDLKQLLEEARARGMRVIFDFVPNHTGLGFWAFKDVVEKGPESPYWDWYFIWKWPFRPGDPTAYDSWWGLGNLPKLNTTNPEVQEHLYQVALHWLRFGFSGLRVDVPNELANAHEFFQELRARVKAEFPEAWLVGEIWHLEPVWVQGDQFDAL
ncbi:MAG: alpha-amylase family glycosyl hydrolase, partial [Candidatus Bipolaricaulaceae bacterium]